MSRIPAESALFATPRGLSLLQEASLQLDGAPAMVRGLAHSPAALEGFLRFRASLASGQLPAPARVLIALAVSEINGCAYCLAAHVAAGAWQGLTDREIADARQCRSANPKHQAMLTLVQSVVIQRGAVSTHEFFAARDAGLSHGELTEIVGHISLSLFTNYFNQLALTEMEIPPPGSRSPAASAARPAQRDEVPANPQHS